MPNHELPTLLDDLKNQATTEMRKVEKTDDVDADFINPIFRQLLINDKYTFEQMKAIMAMNFVNHLLKTKEKNLLEAINELFDKITKNSALLETKSDANHIHQQYLEKTTDIAGTGDLYSRTQVDALIRQLQEKGLTQEQVQSMITAAIILQKLKTVDGTGSGLDADLLDGLHARDFLRNNGKAMDSHKLEGHPSSYFATAAQFQQVFQSLTDGKSTLISAINKRLGYNSGLTTQNTWADFVWWFENKFVEQGIAIVPFNVNVYCEFETTLNTQMKKVLFLQHQYEEKNYSESGGSGRYNISTLIPVEPSKWIRTRRNHSSDFAIAVFVYPDFQKIRVAWIDRNNNIYLQGYGGLTVSFTLIGIK